MKIKHLFQHIALFVVVEFLFVLLIFREVPSVNVVSFTGIAHLIYWLVIIFFGWLRDRTQKVWQKFLLTFSPIVLHVLVHGAVTREVFQEHGHHETHVHDEHNIWRMIIGSIVAGIVILAGEYLLHRTTHCTTHHQSAHKKCQTSGHEQCEHSH